jgi:16S rRNA (uracil1498-N3)-methyltransferase
MGIYFMPQFFIDKDFEVGSDVEIRGADAKHVTKVLRLARGDWLVLSDGSGKSYSAEIRSVSPRAVTAHVVGMRFRRKKTELTLALSLIKHDRTETIVQKAVELGITRIIPFHSERTVPRYVADADDRKLDRWRKIAMEAAKQSGLPFVPAVEPPLPFAELCRYFGDFEMAILFWEGEDRRDIASYGKKLSDRGEKLVVIGPEGGFTKGEVDAARKAGAFTASLGAQILRVETAAVAALSICLYESGDFNLK